jgi:uncharacterized membrane protein YukC
MISTSYDKASRQELLLDYLAEYNELTISNPLLTERLSFDAYVQFSITYHMGDEVKDTIQDSERAIDNVKDAIDEVRTAVDDVDSTLIKQGR